MGLAMLLVVRRIARHKLRRTFLLIISVMIGLSGRVLAQVAEHPAPAGTSPYVLVLYSYGYGGRGVEIFSDGFLSAMTARGVAVSDLYFEYLDLERNRDPDYRVRLMQSLNRKYARRDIGLIVTVQQPALEFLLQDGLGLAPGRPVVSVQAPAPSEASARDRYIVSLLANFDISGTLERAVQIFPETKNVLFVSGSSPADRRMAEASARAAAGWDKKLNFEYTTGRSYEEILARSHTLPPHSLIIFTQYNDDLRGHVALAYEVENRLVRMANAPVFGLYDFNLVNGGIGGSVISVRSLGTQTADLALNILDGKFVPDKPVTALEMNAVPTFDWRRIKQWGGITNNLGPDTVFVNKTPTLWEQYKAYIISMILFTLFETLLIGGLLIHRRQRARAENRLRNANAELEQFAYVASHDLRQPLRMVTNYLILIEKRLGSQLEGDLRTYFGFAVDGARKMDRLIADLLEYSRTGRHRDIARVQLGDAVAEALLVLTEPIRQSEAKVSVDDGNPAITGNWTELVRLFQNLIGNAIKYRSPERPPKIDIGWRRQGGEYLVWVKDNGMGIAPEDREKVFQIFHRLVPRDSCDGAGIGLAICKKIVDSLGGRIWIESELGQGCTFFMTFPT